MINYVDLETMEICSKTFLLRKHSMAKAADAPLTADDLAVMNAAVLDESATGDIATGRAVLNNGVYQREYRGNTIDELSTRERTWRNAQFPLVEIALNRVNANHSSKVGTIIGWYDYQNALRDYPQGIGFPDRTLNPRPVEPQ